MADAYNGLSNLTLRDVAFAPTRLAERGLNWVGSRFDSAGEWRSDHVGWYAGWQGYSLGGVFHTVAGLSNFYDNTITNYQRYDELGIGRWDATVLMFNPATGAAEAIYGVSYQAGDFGHTLDANARWTRGIVSSLSTVATGLGGVAGLRQLVNGSVNAPITAAKVR